VLNGLAGSCVLKVCTVSPPKTGEMVAITSCFPMRYDLAKPVGEKELLGDKPPTGGVPRAFRPHDVAKARLYFASLNGSAILAGLAQSCVTFRALPVPYGWAVEE
jgi:hypothetical protein